MKQGAHSAVADLHAGLASSPQPLHLSAIRNFTAQHLPAPLYHRPKSFLKLSANNCIWHW